MNDEERRKLHKYYEDEKKIDNAKSSFGRLVSSSFLVTFVLKAEGTESDFLTSVFAWAVLTFIVWGIMGTIDDGVKNYFEATEKFISAKNIWILICATGLAYFISGYIFR
jgi:Na+/citrate or Na+/malate symporter